MNEDDMDVAFAADEDDDCGRDDGCKQSKCKHGKLAGFSRFPNL